MRHSTRLALVLALLGGCKDEGPVSPDTGRLDAGPDLPLADLLVSPDQELAADAGRDSGPYVPKPAEIFFSAVKPLPAGEQIVFNDWNAAPNSVFSVTPDGKTTTEIFRAFRVWSLAVSRGADQIAFACGDPLQQQHYGIALGDAIQHTWIYDVKTQSASVVAHGNLNDECHNFGPQDTALYVCRRYDFTSKGAFKGWRIGRIDLPAASFSFLTPEVSMEYHLSPELSLDSKTLYFGRIQISGGSQVHAIMRQALPGGTAEVLRDNANRPALSPDGTAYVYENHADNRHLYAVNLSGGDPVKVVAAQGSSVTYSPDGQQIAYTLWDVPKNCAHIEVAKVDGSEVEAPRRIRDCGVTKEFITELDWITR